MLGHGGARTFSLCARRCKHARSPRAQPAVLGWFGGGGIRERRFRYGETKVVTLCAGRVAEQVPLTTEIAGCTARLLEGEVNQGVN